MPVDPTGTKPGLVSNEKKPDEVHIRCKSCGHMVAIEITPKGARGRMYQCVKCKQAWGIDVGGGVNLG